jgi:hypothetical protein
MREFDIIEDAHIENDWYIVPLIILIGVMLATVLAIQAYGPDMFIEKVATIISYYF